MAPITILQDVLKSTLATMDELKDSLPDIHPCKLSVVLCDKNGLCYGGECRQGGRSNDASLSISLGLFSSYESPLLASCCLS
jgi:hypothetical protein